MENENNPNKTQIVITQEALRGYNKLHDPMRQLEIYHEILLDNLKEEKEYKFNNKKTKELFEKNLIKLQKKISEEIFIDDLTGLFNSKAFESNLKRSMRRAERSYWKSSNNPRQLALIYLDINKFKEINDNYGHTLGDKVLKNLAKAMKEYTRKSDIHSRIGGDEFGIILDPLIQEPTGVLERLTNNINEYLSEKIKIESQITVSLGMSIFKEDAKSTEQIKIHADNAMYFAKKNPKNGLNFHLYNPKMINKYIAKEDRLGRD